MVNFCFNRQRTVTKYFFLKHFSGLRKQARILENDIDVKLVAFSKVGAGGHGSNSSSGIADTAPLLGDSVFESLSLEIAQMLEKVCW